MNQQLQSLHADSRTDLPDTDYFFLGSGRLSAAIQWSRNAEATPLGIILFDPDHFTRKWGSYLFHPEYGLQATMLTVIIDGIRYVPKHEELSVEWCEYDGVPTVLAHWMAGDCDVWESFFTAVDSNILVRWVNVHKAGDRPVEIETGLYANPTVYSSFDSSKTVLFASGHGMIAITGSPTVQTKERYITIIPERIENDNTESQIVYAAADQLSGIQADLSEAFGREKAYWEKTTSVTSNVDAHRRIVELFDAAKNGLRAAVSSTGKFDSGIWQYGMEWGRDASRVAEALVYCGQFDVARRVLVNILTRLSTEDGMVAEASRFRGGKDSELDSNGLVLSALRTYSDWTGDTSVCNEHWDRIVAIADYLTRPEFLNAETSMLTASRDIWERVEAMGIEPGSDVAHITFAIRGLGDASALAASAGKLDESSRWLDLSSRMNASFLSHPTHSLIEEGIIRKRRLSSGSLQLELRIDRNKEGTDFFSKFVPKEMPLASAGAHRLEPDIAQVFAVLFGLVDAQGEIARTTFDAVTALWSQAWKGGGLGRYDISGEPDSPGPWSLATIFFAQAALQCDRTEWFDNAIAWLSEKAGAGGSWFEFYGKRPTPPLPPVGILAWSWAEFITLVVRDMLGASVVGSNLICAPKMKGLSARIRFRNSFVECTS